jgi:intracellular sulfur oxidation DsrE/DsrF family protein
MKLRSVLAVSVMGCMVSLLPLSASAQTKKVHHVLFAVTSPDENDWRLAAGNMRNLLAGLSADDVEIEVVAFGPGISMVKKGSAAEADLKALEAKNVKVFACQNAMRGANLTVADLIEGTGTVPAGIVEVVTKQEQDWVYIKAGR